MCLLSRYGWGVDGLGRAFIDKDSNCLILLCMLPGNSGKSGVDLLEEQDDADPGRDAAVTGESPKKKEE